MSPHIAGAERSMFSTFQGLNQPKPEPQEPPKPTTNGTAKRITTPHACAECKRRKIRCDGKQPCGQCVGCRSPKPCYYDKHRQRVIPSRKTLDALTQSLEECRNVLRRLYPNRDPNTLLNLSRQELISLLDRPAPLMSGSQASPTTSNTSPQSNEFQSPITASEDNQSLADLEQIPSQDVEWDEERRARDPIPVESDDVNALSLSVERQTSYLGATSIKAAFLVMLRVAPVLRSFLTPSNQRENRGNNAQVGNYPTPRPAFNVSAKSLLAIPWSSEGQTLIDAYFKRVQIFIPMLDEPTFRADYLSGKRHDGPWLALLNMVFTMGSIVANKSDDHQHVNYYNRAKEHLQIDSFGSGHIETLQALALMGGFYLHYINRPNMANAICGAALRIACAMGLHRETPAEPGQSTLLVEQRRRTWWSLFCLDTWASTTLGRPSMGRWGQAITIRPPEGPIDPNVMGDNINIIPLIENIKFCHIATRIQDALAHSPVLRTEDRDALDAQLSQWYDHLHVSLRSTDACNENIYTARCVMKWRYQNLRIVLFRPVLLNLANKSTQGQPPSPEDLAAVTKLRAISKQTIEDIARECGPNQMLGWNGVWFLYQASMIPLVSIFWERWNTRQVQECQHQIEIVLDAMHGMLEWSLAARRSREVLVKMYEASKRPITRQTSPRLDPMHLNSGQHPQMMMTQNHGEMLDPNQQILQQHMYQPYNMLDENGMVMQVNEPMENWALNDMLWGGLPEGYDAPFDGMPYETGYEGQDMQQQQQQQQHNGMVYKYEVDGNVGPGGYMMQH